MAGNDVFRYFDLAFVCVLPVWAFGYVAWQRRKSDRRWVEMTNHDVSPSEHGIVHHSTCWCRK